jgi:hypothetical protein
MPPFKLYPDPKNSGKWIAEDVNDPTKKVEGEIHIPYAFVGGSIIANNLQFVTETKEKKH